MVDVHQKGEAMDRNEFTELVYETFADEPDNVLANGIIEAADAYVEYEKAQLSKESTTSDLISRTATINAVNNAFDRETLLTQFVRSIAVRAIRDMPTAQPERKEGHWIWVAGELMCSECRTIYSDLYPDYDNAVACPHCGAKMTISTK